VPMLSRAGFEEEIERADVVISHAGVGSLHTAIRYGHTPIVFARHARLSEHVNDHQVDLVEAFAGRSRVLPAEDEASLLTQLAIFLPGTMRRHGAGQIVDAVTLQCIADAVGTGTSRTPIAGPWLARLLAGFGPPLSRLQQSGQATASWSRPSSDYFSRRAK
jgi:hypothetical protein